MADTSPSANASNQSPSRPGSPTLARPTPLGIYDRPRSEGISGIEIAAIALSAIWLLGSAVFFLSMPSAPEGQESGNSGLMFLMTMLAIFMPVGMIWVAATAAKASRVMREESQRLQAAIDAIRQAYIAQQHSRDKSIEPSVARKLDEIAAAAKKTETTLATFHTRRDAVQPARHTPPPMAPQAADDQPKLALGTTSEETAPPSRARISSAP